MAGNKDKQKSKSVDQNPKEQTTQEIKSGQKHHPPKAQVVTNSLLGVGYEPETNTPPEENTKIQVLVEAIGQTYNKNDIQLKTELNKNQVLALAKNKAFSRRYRVPILEEIATNIMENSLSLNRGSRKEFENIVTASLQSVVSDEAKRVPNLPDRLFKGR